MKASNGNKPAASLLNPGDVKDGDVLLSCGWGKLSKTICLLDGGNYSHSAICAGADVNSMPLVIEATKKGVVANQLKDEIAVQKYVDVYRFKADTGDTFESPEWPPKPVVDKAIYYKDRGTQYAYNQLFLMGMLVLMRKVPVGKLGQARLRYWLAKFIKHFKDNSTSSKENVICSELIYRCFYEANAEPKGKYGLTISGTISPDGHLIKALAPGANPPNMGFDQETTALFQEAAKVLLKIRPDLQETFRHASKPGNSFSIRSANPNVCADMVTPCDLQKSPNLKPVGRLKPKPIRSWLKHLMNCCIKSSRSI
jgi:hypothetical protein